MPRYAVTTNMDNSNTTDSPLGAAAGAAGPHATDAFKLLSDETRLAILVALWESYDPHGTDNALSFSELYDRVGVRDSGNFTYHLDKLTGHYVAETDDGYELRNAGHKIVQAVIAGAGIEETTLPPTEIDRTCHRCGAPVELSYEDERLYQRCTECEGNIGPESIEQAPSGTLMVWDHNPAGLTDRSPGEVFVAGSIEFLRDAGLHIRGICSECSGPVDPSLHICETHESRPGKVCPNCGTRDEVRVSYICSVCKHGASSPVEAAVKDHPAVVAFRYEHGIELTYDTKDTEACGRLWDHLMEYEHTLVSEDPVRIRVTVPGDGETLQLTLDGNLNVVDVSESSGGW